jgi:HSP20 family protein
MALPTRRRDTLSEPAQRWEPLREFDELQQRTAQLMESVWSGSGVDPLGWTPLVDIEETDDAWIVEAEVPGAQRDDIDVELRDTELFVSGEIKERERTGILRRRTRRRGRFELRVTLPGQADPDGIDATLDDGVLTIRIPKAEQARSRRISVEARPR